VNPSSLVQPSSSSSSRTAAAVRAYSPQYAVCNVSDSCTPHSYRLHHVSVSVCLSVCVHVCLLGTLDYVMTYQSKSPPTSAPHSTDMIVCDYRASVNGRTGARIYARKFDQNEQKLDYAQNKMAGVHVGYAEK